MLDLAPWRVLIAPMPKRCQTRCFSATKQLALALCLSQTVLPREAVNGLTVSDSVWIRIGRSIDDCEEVASTGLVYSDSSDLELVDDLSFAGAQSAVGLHFRRVPIRIDSRVTTAYLTFTTDDTDSTPAFLRIFAEAADDATEFTCVRCSLAH